MTAMTNSPSSVRGIAHTGITVRDIAASVSLWRDVFGFELLGTADLEGRFLSDLVGVADAGLTAAVLSKNGSLIELLQYRAPDERQEFAPRPCDVGNVHVALEVTDLDAVISACHQSGLRSAGPVMMGEGPMQGTRMAYLHTPDGVTIELLEPSI